jgi:ribonuclease HII
VAKRLLRGQDEFWAQSGKALEMSIASSQACLCGVDEAGRGPLAGPVVAAAVIFRDCETLWRSNDSKALSRPQREELFSLISWDLEIAVGTCSVEEIDKLNILRASLLAMEKAVLQLPRQPTLVLVDGNQRLNPTIVSRPIVHGDARVCVIGAASIVAKVTRDRLMRELNDLHPGYGFDRHFGYPTAEHRECLRRLGPSPAHRRTFRGVRELLQPVSEKD